MNKSNNSQSKISLVTFPEQRIGLLEKLMDKIVKEDWTKIINHI